MLRECFSHIKIKFWQNANQNVKVKRVFVSSGVSCIRKINRSRFISDFAVYSITTKKIGKCDVEFFSISYSFGQSRVKKENFRKDETILCERDREILRNFLFDIDEKFVGDLFIKIELDGLILWEMENFGFSSLYMDLLTQSHRGFCRHLCQNFGQF
jgi:hypothetical protein